MDLQYSYFLCKTLKQNEFEIWLWPMHSIVDLLELHYADNKSVIAIMTSWYDNTFFCITEPCEGKKPVNSTYFAFCNSLCDCSSTSEIIQNDISKSSWHVPHGGCRSPDATFCQAISNCFAESINYEFNATWIISHNMHITLKPLNWTMVQRVWVLIVFCVFTGFVISEL